MGAAGAAIAPSIRGFRCSDKGKTARQCAIHDSWRIKKSEFVFRQQWLAFVVQTPAISLHVVKPNVISAAGMGFGEQQLVIFTKPL